MFFTINIEPTDYCSTKCKYCIHSKNAKPHNRKQGFMEFGLWKRIVDQLDALKRDGHILEDFDIRPYWLGESFLHPQYYDMLSYLFDKHITNHILITTNATHMSPEYSDLILKYTKNHPDVNFYITFGIDGLTSETVRDIKQANVAKRVYKNIETMVERRKKLGINNLYLIYQSVVLPDNSGEMEQFYNYWREYLNREGIRFNAGSQWSYDEKNDYIWIKRCDVEPEKQNDITALHKLVCQSLGLMNNECNIPKETCIKNSIPKAAPQTIIKKANPCYMAWQLAICWDGTVSACCLDNFMGLEIGNLNKQSLEEITFGEKAIRLRMAHINKELEKYPTCYTCSAYQDAFTNWPAEMKIQETVELSHAFYKNETKEPAVSGAPVASGEKQKLDGALNICLVSREYPPETGWGGIGTYVYHLAHALANLGHQVHILAQSLEEDKEYFDEEVHVHRIAHRVLFPHKGLLREFALRLEYSYGICKKLKEVIKKYQIDIVEVPNFSAEGFVYSFLKGTPLVTRLHTHFSEVLNFLEWPNTFDRRLSCWLEDAAIQRSDLITCSTEAHTETISSKTSLDSDKVEIIPLGIRLSGFKGETRSSEQGDDLSVLFVGRLEKRKGVHVLIKSIPHVLSETPNVNFYIIGRDTFVTAEKSSFIGNEKESFKEKLIVGIPECYRKNVHFLDYIEDEKLSEYYDSCDIFVAPSLYESFGLIYIEAMSHAKPVVGCGVGGVPEVIQDGETGLLVPPDDPKALANAIIKLTKDREIRGTFGRNGLKHVEKHFTRELMAQNTVKAYEKVLKQWQNNNNN